MRDDAGVTFDFYEDSRFGALLSPYFAPRIAVGYVPHVVNGFAREVCCCGLYVLAVGGDDFWGEADASAQWHVAMAVA